MRTASENALLALCNHSAFGVTPVIQKIVASPAKASGPAKNTKKTMNSNKLIISKYGILARILAEVRDIPQDMIYAALDFTVVGLSHALQDVR